MQSFSQKTKEMLCKCETGKACCAAAELAGLSLFAARKTEGELRFVTENSAVAERICRLIARCFDAKVEPVREKSCFVCRVNDERLVAKLCGELCEMCGDEILPKNARVRKECCRGAFLRGAFLGGGTIVDPNKNYNLELVTVGEKLCVGVRNILAEMGLEFRQTVRRGNFVLYAKNSETICDSLTYMGAFGSNMEILNIKIERELRNNLNRAANGETANFDKVVKAAVRQIAAIEKIDRTIGIDELPQELREMARLRMTHKNLSLEELGKLMNPTLTKSGVNHRLKKLTDIAELISE